MSKPTNIKDFPGLTPVQRAIRESDARFLPLLEAALRRCANAYERSQAIRAYANVMRVYEDQIAQQYGLSPMEWPILP
jgi:hypothetical protein